MREWTEYVREHLSLPDLEGPAARGVVEEVGCELEEVYVAAGGRGLSEAAAEAEARAHVGDWEELAATVRRASRTRRERLGKRTAERADAGL
ncbi:MAG: hypothetical protein P8Z36_12825, partial [Gemmatimonadota bacterium]